MNGGLSIGAGCDRCGNRAQWPWPLLSSVPSPALAAERPFGDMVEYELVFPVDGPNEYSDSFWAGRSHGTHGSQDIMADKGVPVVCRCDRNGETRELEQASGPQSRTVLQRCRRSRRRMADGLSPLHERHAGNRRRSGLGHRSWDRAGRTGAGRRTPRVGGGQPAS